MEISVRYLPMITVCLFILTMSIKLHLALTACIEDCFPRHSMTDANQTDTAMVREMCFFGQAGNVLWLLGSFLLYVKYRQVNDICNRYDMNKKKIFNKVTLLVGLISCLGVSILANFREINLFYVHWIGVFLFFGFGSLYQSMQTGLYFGISKIIGLRRVIPLRIALSVLSVISFVIFFVCAMIKNHKQCHHGCELHEISIVFEMICAISTMVYLALFYWEFTKITLYEPDFFVIEKFTSSVNMQQTNEAFEDK